ncbi:MAG: flagellar biosynthesis protein FlhA [Nitrospirota bacterium]
MDNTEEIIPNWAKNSDLILGIGVIVILSIMILPLPSVLLDLLLSFNITLSIVIILISMYIIKPLEFSVFPTILLISTLFRLSLNIASTRLILLHGNEGAAAAGQVIKSFGNFVVGGNYTVGLIVFAILVIINFMVITKGAGRVAEVAARFTLDAMPGKQMSIDADLNAGTINDIEAKIRRETIAHEADFYGAMDGASKFVRGDAIAAVIIMIVNVVGGLLIGVFQYNMPVVGALQNFTLLTVGDGLMAQVPALIVSTAAGIVVTRAASESNLGMDITRQIIIHPKAIATSSVILFFFGMVPGLPHLPFITLSAILGTFAYINSIKKREVLSTIEEEREEKAKETSVEKIESLLSLDLMELNIGYGLIPLVDQDQDGDLLERIRLIRRQCALDIGIIVPPIHIRDNLQLKQNEYSILIKGIEVGKGELIHGRCMAIDPGTAKKGLEGIQTIEPCFGLPALWIANDDKDKAKFLGYTVVDLSTIIATHLTEIIKSHGYELLGRQEVQTLLDNLSKSCPKVVEELIPNLLPLGVIVMILKNLLKERLPVRDLRTILETIADYAPITKDPEVLTEYVRQSLARSITRQYLTQDGVMHVITLDMNLDEKIASAIQQTNQGSYIALEPNFAQRIFNRLKQVIENITKKGYQPILLCSPRIRSHFKKWTESLIPQLVVLSPNEITSNVRIQPLDIVRITDAD